MNNKIPPPIVLIVFLLLMKPGSMLFAILEFDFQFRSIIAYGLGVLGLLVLLEAGLRFVKAKTTVNPLELEKTSTLVVSGVFKYSRNPMYLGMLFILIAGFLKMANFFNILSVILFVLYINQFQIKPEEKALVKLFGEQFADYCSKVRRWI